jgi:hypothetical protein
LGGFGLLDGGQEGVGIGAMVICHIRWN